MNKTILAAVLVVLSSCGPQEVEADDQTTVEQEVVANCGSRLAVTSISASVDQVGNLAPNAVDGNLATRWSGKGTGATLTADLGATKQLCSISLGWYLGDQRTNTFRLEASSNGTTWSQIAASTSALTTALQSVTFATVNARYVRLVWLSNSVANNEWSSVTEFQPYGVTPFTLGQTKPVESNSGAGVIRALPTAPLYGDQTITVDNTVLADKVIHGRVIVKAKNVLISNCIIDGGDVVPTGAHQLVDTTSATNARIEFSTLRAKNPTYNTNGIGWRNYTAYRVNVSRVVDAFTSAPATNGGPVNVSIQGSYGHDLVHFSPDPGHPATPTSPSRTHNDVVQSHGGVGLQVIGSNFAAYHDQTIGTQPAPHEQLAAMMINTNRTLGHSIDLDIRDNWFGGGVYCINGGGATGGGGTFLRNKFDRGSAGNGDSTYTLVFDSLFSQTSTGNVYEDTGAAVRVRTGY